MASKHSKTAKNRKTKTSKRGKTKPRKNTTKPKKKSDWLLFIKKLMIENPQKKFGEVLKMASNMKKQGVNIGNYVNKKSASAMKKINKTLKNKK